MKLQKQLTDRILKLTGVEQRKSRFGDRLAFYAGGREFAHFHARNEIDIRLTRQRIRALKEELSDDARVHMRGNSDWLEFEFARRVDIDRAFQLVEEALAANRA